MKKRFIHVDRHMKKRCARCNRKKLIKLFSRRKAALDGRHPWCRSCVKDYSHEWWSNHPEAYAAKKKRISKSVRETHRIPKRVYARARQNAIRRGLSFNLTIKWVTEQIDKGCAVTKHPFDLSSTIHRPFAPSIDRINCLKGYTQKNCQMVYLIYNYAKNAFRHEDVMELMRRLA